MRITFINHELKRLAPADTRVVEVDVAPNTRRDAKWSLRGRQSDIPSLGRNRKRHNPGSTQTIQGAADNYGIHTGRVTHARPAHHLRIRLPFRPAHHPLVNAVERRWNAMQYTITRHPRCIALDRVMKALRRFIKISLTFPGNELAPACALAHDNWDQEFGANARSR